MTTKQIGNLGETLASQYLINNGYKILEKNIKLSNLEIDIITFKNKRHTFFEVKTGQQININDNYLTKKQIINLKKATHKYAALKNINFENITFDLLIISLNTTTRQAEIKHYFNIF